VFSAGRDEHVVQQSEGVSQEAIVMQFDIQPATEANGANPSVRRHPRALLSVPIVLRHLTKDEIRATRGISLDISEGGVGALVQGQLLVGETVEMDIHMHEHPLRAAAIVRYTCSARAGFEFLGLTAEERLQIADVVGNC
jgi:PilZ domain